MSHKRFALALSIGLLMVWVFVAFAPYSSSVAAGFFLTPTPTSPPAPTLVAPADGTHTTDTTPHFYWNPIPGSPMVHYAPTIDSMDGSFHRSWLCTSCTDMEAPEALPIGGYYWYVNSSLGYPSNVFTLYIDGTGTVTETITPTTCVPLVTPPELLRPKHRTHTTDTTPTFTWTSVTGAQSYRLTLYTEDRSLEYKKRVFSTTYTIAANEALPPSKYFWRVRAQDQNCGTWSGWSRRNTLFVN